MSLAFEVTASRYGEFFKELYGPAIGFLLICSSGSAPGQTDPP